MPPPPAPHRRPPQISLKFLMLMMVIFAATSAGLFYASGVPMVQDELRVLTNASAPASDDSGGGRRAHIVFIMFTFTAPLLLAMVLSTAVGVIRWMNRRT